MKPIFHCEIDYYTRSPHLNLMYDGFAKLQRAGVIDLRINCKKGCGYDMKGIFTVMIDSKYKVIFDALDGFNWISGPIEDNLVHFRENIRADFYFKRSYSKLLLDYLPEKCRLFPLGLNYDMYPEGNFPKEQPFIESVKDMVKYMIQKTPLISRLYTTRKYFHYHDFEALPFADKANRILFLARLWDPDEIELEHLKEERERINHDRIACIKACKDAFGKRFTGGLQNSNFSLKHARELVVPQSLTDKQNFLNTTKTHNICVATIGLHDSIGWKFGEYVASSRAIVTEPLKYELPGVFENEKNYLEFQNKDELLNQITRLSEDKELLFEMMSNNYIYYNNFLRPDKLVLNTLLKVYQETQ